MVKKEFFNNSRTTDMTSLDLLHENEIDYCVIGGLAVNAYVEPVVSLDLDIIIATDTITSLNKRPGNYSKQKRFNTASI